jgi:catechol 2,3-dioxygenase
MAGSIHPDAALGPVALTVSNLDRSIAFYTSQLGFQVHHHQNGTASLGAGGPDLLLLSEQPGARHAPHTTGLYHFAVLVPSRLDLAHALRRIAETRTPVQGFADHGVSEAIYLPDPDSTGIEIYRDRGRAEWPMIGDELQMVTDPLDLDDLLGELNGQGQVLAGLPTGTAIGHVHLHVRSIPEAEAFYCEVLGFDLMQRYGPSAAFLSAGGYHHHIGINTWVGVGAPPPPDGSTGLRWFTVNLPSQSEVDRVTQRIAAVGVPFEQRADGVFVRDPSHNGILLTVR